MISKDDYKALLVELDSLRREIVQTQFGDIPRSVEALEQKLAQSSSDEDRQVLYSLLVSECSRCGNDQVYIDALRRRLRDYPDDAMAKGGLAHALAVVCPDSREEPLRLASESVALAIKDDRLVRYCATNMARIALTLDAYGVLDSALAVLIDDAVNIRVQDSPYEFDFVDRIDVSRVNLGLLKRYRQLAKM